jgi:hypothetical protein
MDGKGAMIAPKSAAGRRSVPIPKVLRTLLMRHQLLRGRENGYVFGSTTGLHEARTRSRR